MLVVENSSASARLWTDSTVALLGAAYSAMTAP